MKAADRWITLLLAAAGISTCLLGVGGFVWTVFSNNLPWSPGTTARDYYLEIGKTYSQGFIMGFFLCFFLVLVVVTLGAMLGFVRDRTSPEEPKPARRRLRIVRNRGS